MSTAHGRDSPENSLEQWQVELPTSGENASLKEQVMMVRIIKNCLFCGYFSDLWRFLVFGWRCMAFAVLAATNYVE